LDRITILDYGAGNIKSVTNILEFLRVEYIITDKKEDIKNAERIIMPGQGHFGQFMQALNTKGLSKTLMDKINDGTPFMGICLGIQVLFEYSEEAPDVKGLGIFPGKVQKFTKGKIPQIGWNELKITQNNSILTNDYVYFVNSYHVVPENKNIVSAHCKYHNKFVAAIEHRNVVAFQFHPEKSGEIGYGFIKKWLVKN